MNTKNIAVELLKWAFLFLLIFYGVFALGMILLAVGWILIAPWVLIYELLGSI